VVALVGTALTGVAAIISIPPHTTGLPTYGPLVATAADRSEPPRGAIVTIDPALVIEPTTGEDPGGQRLLADYSSLAESDRRLVDEIDRVLTGAAVDLPTLPDGSLDVASLLEPALPDGVEPRSLGANLWLVPGAGIELDELASIPGVVAVEPDLVAYPTDDPLQGDQWGLANDGRAIQGSAGLATADIGWDAAHTIADGSGLVVAVIDTGIDTSHPDLAGVMWNNPGETCANGLDDDGNGWVDDCNGYDFVNRDGSIFDGTTRTGAPVDNNHGTHVAGIVAAAAGNGVGGAGVAPGVEVMSLKVFENGGAGLSTIIEAIDYASANGATILNLSLGTPPGSSYPQAMADAITRAGQRGALVVVAAGNDGVDIDRTPVWPASLGNDNLLTVGASTNADTRASFSNYGSHAVDVFAPGQAILSTVPGGYAFYHGTSMATPMASGVAALVSQALGTTDPGVVKAALLDGAMEVDAFAAVSTSGGRLSGAGGLGLAALYPASVSVVADGLGPAMEPDVATHLTLGSPDAVGGGVDIELTLGVLVEGVMHAVLDHPVSVTGGASGAATTDATGSVALTLDAAARADLQRGTLTLDVTVSLPDGAYALLVGGTAADGTVLRPQLLSFGVGDEPPPPTPADPDTSGGVAPGGATPGTGSPPATGDHPAPAEPTPGESTPPVPSPIDGGTVGEQPGGVGGSTAPPAGGTPTPGGGSNGAVGPPGTGTTVPSDDTPDTSTIPPGVDTGTPAPPGSDSATGPPQEDPERSVVSPTSGPASGGSLVRIDRSFSRVSSVWFGGLASPFVMDVGAYVLAATPAHQPGTVDVVVNDEGGAVTFARAFTYLASSDPTTPGAPGTPVGGGESSPVPPVSGGGEVVGGGPGTGGSPPQPSPVDPGAPGITPAPTTTTTTTAPNPFQRVAGAPRPLENGLVVDPFVGSHPLAGVTGTVLGLRVCGPVDCRGSFA
jgi:subtilisin family serine protease